VARHGDGVAVIAFGVAAAEAAFAESVAAGARPVEAPRAHTHGARSVKTATVGGFGDVVHRLVERPASRAAAGSAASAADFLPGAIDVHEAADASDAPDADPEPPPLLHAVDHAAFCVPAGELESTVEYYRRVFGFQMIFEEYVEVGEQGMYSQVVQSPSGGVTFTLIQPDIARSPGQIDDFLAWHGGPGVQHVALSTSDIVRAVGTLGERGVGFAFTPAGYYDLLDERLGAVDVPVEHLKPLGILVDRDHWGQLYQIFAKSMHVRRTFFWELIERHGARTFGTSNIPALYAAKERELAILRDTVEAGRS
jgi:4-hydroxymandelate synthase